MKNVTGFMRIANAIIHKRRIINTHFAGSPCTEKWDASDKYSLCDTAVLHKDEGRDFVILNITDPHFSDYDIRAFMAFAATRTIKRLVRDIKPDLITVTGDIVCGGSTEYSIRRFTALMDSFSTPWAPVFGNHDAETNCDYNYLADIMLKSPHCLMKKGDPRLGCGNYVVNIASSRDESIIHSLIMTDTHKTHLSDSQIQWYKWAALGVSEANGRKTESSVMMHIPCAEYQYAYDAAYDEKNVCWREGFEASGSLNEKICCHRDKSGEPVNNGFFAAVKETGSTKNIICGHEHMNDFSILYDGVRLTYTLKAGRGSGFMKGMNGGTKITVSDAGLSIQHIYI
ncbi:MAG: hypothetical protein GX051_05920 [Clostridiales bacterium]|nr:hypothetical protein [Clostridiales bacterium]